MAAETIHDLLPIPAGINKPHPYQVLGLEPGEQDPAKIKAAIRHRIAALKAAQSETDAALWNRAAKLVNQSRAILSDPQKKAELDARFGIIAVAGAAAPDAAPATTALDTTAPADPLAGWLPPGDPLAAWVPGAQSGGDSESQPEGVSESLPVSAEESVKETPAASAASSPANEAAPETDAAPADGSNPADRPAGDRFPLVVDSSPGTATAGRRRKSSARRLVPAVTAALVLLASGLAYFLFWGPGGIEIRSGQGQLTVSTKSNAGPEENATMDRRSGAEQSETSPEESTDSNRERSDDPVMGGLSPGGKGTPRRGNSLAADLQASGIAIGANGDSVDEPEVGSEGTSDAPPADGGMDNSRQEATSEAGGESSPDDAGGASERSSPRGATEQAAETETPSEGMPAGDAMAAGALAMAGDGEDDSPPANARESMPPGAASSPQQIDQLTAEADAAIERAIEQIRSAQWQQMKPAAEQATEIAMTETQKELAESLYQLADLATYYRGGIERAVGQLEAGDEIELTSALSVIVVDANEDALAIRRSGARNYRFPLDELPMVITDALAPYSMDADEPTTVAAQAAYQAVASFATEAHRQHAAETLRGITGEVEGADPERVAAAIERVFRRGSE